VLSTGSRSASPIRAVHVSRMIKGGSAGFEHDDGLARFAPPTTSRVCGGPVNRSMLPGCPVFPATSRQSTRRSRVEHDVWRRPPRPVGWWPAPAGHPCSHRRSRCSCRLDRRHDEGADRRRGGGRRAYCVRASRFAIVEMRGWRLSRRKTTAMSSKIVHNNPSPHRLRWSGTPRRVPRSTRSGFNADHRAHSRGAPTAAAP